MTTKILLAVITLFFSVFFKAQKINDSTLIKQIDKEVENIRNIFDDYLSKREKALSQNKLFKYSYDSSSYLYDIYRPTYDSLVLKKIPDSILLRESRLHIKKNGLKFYLTQAFNDSSNKARFNVYKLNKQVATIDIDDYNFSKYDLESKTQIFRNDVNKNREYSYGIRIFKKRQKDAKGDILSDPSYYKLINNKAKVTEHFYEKEFLLSEDNILKKLVSNFSTQSMKLMAGKKYNRGHDQPDKAFTADDVKYETDILQRILKERENALKGMYDKADLYVKIRKERAISISKGYDDHRNPLYIITVDNGNMRGWYFKVDPRTGDLTSIDYLLQEE